MTKSAEEKAFEEKVAEILRENIYFSGQLGDYVIHGALEKIWELHCQEPASQPKEQPSGEWETRKHPLSGTWAVMHRKEGFTTDFDLYYATSQPAANRLKSLLNASEGDREELRSKDAEIERLRGALQKIIDYPIYNRSWVSDVGEIKDIAYSATQFKNQKEGR
jgi:mRNA-degrading endonuclease YafQ of YafQ-DinJ toxin-antitoxin module